MEYGYVCFSYSKNEWIAKAIAFFTKSKWSHSFITVPSMLNQEMVMEADAGGVMMTLFDQGYRNNINQKYQVFRFKCDPKQIDAAILECAKHLTETYGFLQYPWFIWRSINKLFGRDIKAQSNWSSQGEICSDLTRRFIESTEYKYIFKDYGVDSASAQDIYEIVLSHPELFELVEEKQ